MPLERKILLGILVIIMAVFGGIHIRDTYYTKYKESLKNITAHEERIKKLREDIYQQSQEEEAAEVDYETLIQEEREKFFSPQEASVENIAGYIKSKLLYSGLEITKYSSGNSRGEVSVRFNIQGSSANLMRFLNSVRTDKKYLKVHNMSMKMKDNESMTAVIQAGFHTLEDVIDFNREFTVKNYVTPPLQTVWQTSTVLGESFYVPPPVVEEEPVIVEEKKPEPPKPVYSDKLTFVATLKDKITGEIIKIFTDTANGRILKFKQDQTVAGWTYLGQEGSEYLFKNNETLYKIRG